jgi:GNAT superfamily N-acetyltransferase
MDVQIRKAQVQDAGHIADILRALGWFAHMNSEPYEETRARIARHLELCNADDSHSVYVAENASGDIGGYVSVHWLPYFMLTGPEGYVSELIVREAARGRGIGTRLLAVVEEEAKARGCSRLMLINMRNRESYQRGFYRKRGWEERQNAANLVYSIPKT